MADPNKAVLAFSGGLDTSFIVPYMIDQGYDITTATVNTGGFSREELDDIAERSRVLGAAKHVEIDGREKMFSDIGCYIIRANGLYMDAYPNMCADRYIIAEGVAEVAHDVGATAVVHGSSAMGNDQVRFDLAFRSIAPDLEVIAPIRDTGGNRKRQQDYLESLGLSAPTINRKYSVNQNILGITYSGGEIDEGGQADEEMFQWTQPKRSDSARIAIGFEEGVPTTLDGASLSGEAILGALNERAGEYGFGRGYYTGDCVVGIKGRIAFEAPGVLTLIEAHRALEQLVLTKPQHDIGKVLANQFTELVYGGKYYDPAVIDLKAYMDSQQQKVTGTVGVQLAPNRAQTVAVDSPYTLVDPEKAAYAQSSSWTPEDARGFIKLYGMQGEIAARRDSR